MEIERKFLLKSIPENLENYEHYDIEQAYIFVTPTLRVRKKTSKDNVTYILTVKNSGMMAHDEFETEIDEESYTELLTKRTTPNVISKTRYLIPLNKNLTLELDIFKGAFEGLVMGEVEFKTEAKAKAFVPPEFFSDEVTFDKRFHNSAMSTMSKEDISEFIGFVS